MIHIFVSYWPFYAQSSESCAQESEKALKLKFAVKTDFSFVIIMGHKILYPIL